MVTTATGIATSYIQFTRASTATVTNNVGNIAWSGHNLLTNSESFDAAAWGKAGATVTANSTVAPNGTTTADKLLELGGTSFHGLFQLGGVLTSIPVTFSVFVKGDLGRDWVRVSYDGGGSKTAWFNVANGTIGTVNAGLTASPPQLVGNGFYLIQISFTGAASGSVAIGPAISDGVDSYAGDISKGVTIWGAALYRSDLGGMVFNPAQPAGLGTYYPTTPPNLLASTEYYNNGNWIRTGMRAFGSGSSSNATTAPNGLPSADLITTDSSNGLHSVSSGGYTIPANTTMTYSAYVKPSGYTKVALRESISTGVYASFSLVAGGSLLDKSASASATITVLSDGWYRLTMTVAVASASLGLGVYILSPSYVSGVATTSWTSDGVSGIYLWGAQLSDSASIDPYSPVYGAAVTSSAYYAPRLDYSPTTIQPLGMLVEEQRTNLSLYSRTLETTGSYWGSLTSGAANTIAVNNSPGPDGISTSASLLTFNTAVPGTGTFSVWRQLVSTTANGTYTCSVWLKANTTSTVYLLFNDNAGNRASATCTLTSSWQRFTVTGTTVASITAISFDIGANGFLGQTMTAGTVYVYGAQIELGSFPTSYIPTVASSVTRSADVASVSTQAFPYSSTEGAVVVNATPMTVSGGSYLFALSDGTVNSEVATRITGTPEIVAAVNVGGVAQASMAVGTPVAGVTLKTALGYKANDFAAVTNGGTPATDASGTVPTSDRLTLGSRAAGTVNFLNGHIRQITYLPRRLTNAELQTRTT